VFCGGDAVHRHPPSSGLGSNTSIQDAFNLAWKLAYVVKGWARPKLLESYSGERAPVGAQIVDRANRSRIEYGPINETFRTDGQADPVAAGLAKLREPSPDGVKAREALIAAIELKNAEFNAQGTELNQRYDFSAVIPDPAVGEEVWARDRGLYLQATTRPGAKLPHVWLVDENGHKVSTLDVTQKGEFSLVTGLAGQAWVTAADKLQLPCCAPSSSAPKAPKTATTTGTGPGKSKRPEPCLSDRAATSPGATAKPSGTTTRPSIYSSWPSPRYCTGVTPIGRVSIYGAAGRGAGNRSDAPMSVKPY
jgi:hypothetical protein